MSDLRVLMVAAECAPFAKVGGLADVLGALPVALEKLGVSVTIAIPRHRVIDVQAFGFQPLPYRTMRASRLDSRAFRTKSIKVDCPAHRSKFS